MMSFTLMRLRSSLYGVFGTLRSSDGSFIAVTLEHAYSEGAAFVPKLAQGVYKCVRHPPNRLPYVTFMVTGVPDFQGKPVDGILIHIGNYNKDSEGCILLGTESNSLGITNSKDAFEKFMALLEGVDEFSLKVV